MCTFWVQGRGLYSGATKRHYSAGNLRNSGLLITVATLQEVRALSGGIWQVRVQPTRPYAYLAGQYTEILIDGLSQLYFTIASAPHQPYIELHIQGDSAGNVQLLQRLKQQQEIALAPAAGRCVLRALPVSDQPLLLIASGTGFSQVQAMVEDLLHQGLARALHIYWVADRFDQLYRQERAEQWAQQHETLYFTGLSVEHSPGQSKHQLLTSAILADHADLSRCQAVSCGSPEMVYAVLDGLCEQGFRAAAMLSDAFEFAPREQP